MDSNPSWDWSGVEGNFAARQSPTPSAAERGTSTPADAAAPAEPRAAPRRRHYGPRTCRICFDTEHPQFPTGVTTTFGISSASSRPTYVSDDPELGRLLSPCKCKGSQKYVHEGCLNAWRLANPTEARNYWQCPTCKFTYRMARLHWASALSSRWAQIAVTLIVFVVGIFALGFIADPLVDLWIDPFGTITETVSSVVADIEALEKPQPNHVTWYEHFVKGFFSLGLVGIAKTMLAIPPWQWWSIRTPGTVGRGRRQGTGRGRVEDMSLIFVLIGAFTFLMGTWKMAKTMIARALKHVSDSVIDVDNGEEEDGDGEGDQEDKKDQ